MIASCLSDLQEEGINIMIRDLGAWEAVSLITNLILKQQILPKKAVVLLLLDLLAVGTGSVVAHDALWLDIKDLWTIAAHAADVHVSVSVSPGRRRESRWM